jgi:hypothetical protein
VCVIIREIAVAEGVFAPGHLGGLGVYALLTAHQLIRIAVADAAGAVPGADPDRASFSVALQAPATRSSRQQA